MYLAVDVGGTKTLVAVFDNEENILEQQKFPTPQNYQDFIVQLKSVVESFEHQTYVSAGIAIPGRIDRTNGIGMAFGNLPWQKVPVRQDVSNILKCPVALENDAKAAGLSEALLVIHEFRKLLYVTIGTGIGNAFIINGKLDPNMADSEAGQIKIEYEGRLRDWEDVVSGRAISERFGMRASEITDSRTWYVIAHEIAVGLVDLAAIFTPEIIIIGGGVGSHFEKFEARLIENMKIYENPLFTIPVIRKAQRAEEAVIYGCLELAKEISANA